MKGDIRRTGSLRLDPCLVSETTTRDDVKLAAWSGRWSAAYAGEAKRLHSALRPLVVDMQHVGSTAVKGMPSKPVIDIAIAVESVESVSDRVGALGRLGYRYLGEHGLPRRHYFEKGTPTLFHLHVLEYSDPRWADLILFRDRLRANARLAEEYATLKRSLARQHAHNRAAYQDGKTSFIRAAIAGNSTNPGTKGEGALPPNTTGDLDASGSPSCADKRQEGHLGQVRRNAVGRSV